LYFNIIILLYHRRICGPSLTETLLCGAYMCLLSAIIYIFFYHSPWNLHGTRRSRQVQHQSEKTELYWKNWNRKPVSWTDGILYLVAPSVISKSSDTFFFFYC